MGKSICELGHTRTIRLKKESDEYFLNEAREKGIPVGMYLRLFIEDALEAMRNGQLERESA